MSQQTQNLMKKISLAKVVLNMGVGKSGEPIEIGKKTLVQITGKKPNARNAKKSHRDWGIRKGEPIGIAVTVRGNDATELLKKLLVVKDNQIAEKAFDNEGNLSFGGVVFDPIWKASVSFKIVLLPVVLMFVTSIAASLYPASIAARIKPVEAIHYKP